MPAGRRVPGVGESVTDAAARAARRSGDTLAGRYRVGALLARGGMADVHRGHDLRLDRAVAIKVFRAGAADPARFRNEIALLARMQHRHLVPLLDAGEHAGVPFVVLELCDQTLSQRLAYGPLPPDVVAEVGRGIASALAHIHGAGIVHRDVKPSNILFGQGADALLADFGVARLVDGSRLTAPAMVIGTPGYLAPEQLTGGEVGPPADVYSLGLVLLEALTGAPAFDGPPRELLAAGSARSPDLPTTLPTPWRSLLHRMTELDPGRRPAAGAVAAALGSAALGDRDATVIMPLDDDATAVAPTPVPPVKVARLLAPRRTTAWAAAAVTLATAAVLAIGLLAGDARAPDRDRAADTSATTAPLPTSASTAPASTAPAAPPPEDDPGSMCAEVERQKQAIEQEKQQVEEQHRDDEGTREQRKQELEDEKRTIEERKNQLGC